MGCLSREKAYFAVAFQSMKNIGQICRIKYQYNIKNVAYDLPSHATLNGEGGIRTLAPVTPVYSLSRGAPYSRLGTSPYHYYHAWRFIAKKRRDRDSNPRCLSATPVFKTGSIDHSDISPRATPSAFIIISNNLLFVNAY